MNDFIKEYWENNAKTYKNSHWVSWGDNFAIELEIDNISKFINDNDYVLDVGCANGYASIEQYKRHKIKLTGIDYSEKMIEYANENKKAKRILGDINFEVGNILNLRFEESTFNIVYTTRVLINLRNWEEQIKGIEECIRVTKNGGKIILSEAFWEPLMLLNTLRIIKGLEPLVEHDFNRYLKKVKIEDYLNKKGLSYQCIDFSSIYYLGSRFLRELVTDYKEYKGYENPINKIFFEIEKKYSGGDFGIQQAYIIIK